MSAETGSALSNSERTILKDQNKPSDKKQDHTGQTASPVPATHQSAEQGNKNALRDPIFWLFFVPFVATSAAAFLTYKQWLPAEDQERHSLRAYISVQKIAVSGLPTGNNNENVWHIGPVWENTGNSTARRLMTSSDCKPGALGDNEIFDYAAASQRPHFFNKIFAPHQPAVGRTCQKTAYELADIQKNNKQITIWGSAEYKDIYGARHKTRFCSQLQIFSDPRVANNNPVHVVNDCKYGNCDDEDCDRQDREIAATKTAK
jgi:hypothetical protein